MQRNITLIVNIFDDNDDSALSISSRRGFLRSLKLILRCPKTLQSTITKLLQKEDNFHGPNIREALNFRGKLMQLNATCCLNVDKSLLQAAIIGDFRAIRGLLSCPESDVNVIDEKGRTPLFLASWLRHEKAVQALLNDTNINVNVGTIFDGATPFSIASRKGYFEIMQLLINHEQTVESQVWLIDKWASDFSKPISKMKPTPKNISTATTSKTGKSLQRGP